MKLLIQRVSEAAVEVGKQQVARIGNGLLVLVGAEPQDTLELARKAADKTIRLRIFEDAEQKTNLDIRSVQGEVLVVSQFTLCAGTKDGNRPSFSAAAAPDHAEAIYKEYADHIRNEGVPVQMGQFGEAMNVRLTNRGPFTIPLEFH